MFGNGFAMGFAFNWHKHMAVAHQNSSTVRITRACKFKSPSPTNSLTIYRRIYLVQNRYKHTRTRESNFLDQEMRRNSRKTIRQFIKSNYEFIGEKYVASEYDNRA